MEGSGEVEMDSGSEVVGEVRGLGVPDHEAKEEEREEKGVRAVDEGEEKEEAH